MKAKTRSPRRILAVDPGFNGTGWAVLECRTQSTHLLAWGFCAILNEKHALHERALHIAHQLFTLRAQHQAWDLVIEYPKLFQTTKGQMVARRGDLGKLMYLVGVIAGYWGERVRPIDVNQWKGNLPKRVVEKRVFAYLLGEAAGLDSHAIDAAGIGLYALGSW